MGKGKRIRASKGITPGFSMVSGDAAMDGFQALLARMQANPENFRVGSDLEEFSTGFMCTACAGPASSAGPSACCNAPTIALDVD